MRRAARWIPALVLTLVACSEGLSSAERNTIAKAMKTVEEAPERIRTEVLRTCDKWMHLRRACKDPIVRLNQMECWLEMGLPNLKSALKRDLRNRARDQKVLQHQSFCMERRGWRFRSKTADYM